MELKLIIDLVTQIGDYETPTRNINMIPSWRVMTSLQTPFGKKVMADNTTHSNHDFEATQMHILILNMTH